MVPLKLASAQGPVPEVVTVYEYTCVAPVAAGGVPDMVRLLPAIDPVTPGGKPVIVALVAQPLNS